jgi:hypothetical protein
MWDFFPDEAITGLQLGESSSKLTYMKITTSAGRTYTCGQWGTGSAVIGISDSITASTRVVGFLPGYDALHLNTLGLALLSTTTLPAYTYALDWRVNAAGRAGESPSGSIEFSDAFDVRAQSLIEVVGLLNLRVWYDGTNGLIAGLQCVWHGDDLPVPGKQHVATNFASSLTPDYEFVLATDEKITGIEGRFGANGLEYLKLTTTLSNFFEVGISPADVSLANFLFADEQLLGFYGSFDAASIRSLGVVKKSATFVPPTPTDSQSLSQTGRFGLSNMETVPLSDIGSIQSISGSFWLKRVRVWISGSDGFIAGIQCVWGIEGSQDLEGDQHVAVSEQGTYPTFSWDFNPDETITGISLKSFGSIITKLVLTTSQGTEYGAGLDAGSDVVGISDTVQPMTRVVGFLPGLDSFNLNTLGLAILGESWVPQIPLPSIDWRLYIAGRAGIGFPGAAEFSYESVIRSSLELGVLRLVGIRFWIKDSVIAGMQCMWTLGSESLGGPIYTAASVSRLSEPTVAVEFDHDETITGIQYSMGFDGVEFMRFLTSAARSLDVGADGSNAIVLPLVMFAERVVGFYGTFSDNYLTSFGVIKMQDNLSAWIEPPSTTSETSGSSSSSTHTSTWSQELAQTGRYGVDTPSTVSSSDLIEIEQLVAPNGFWLKTVRVWLSATDGFIAGIQSVWGTGASTEVAGRRNVASEESNKNPTISWDLDPSETIVGITVRNSGSVITYISLQTSSGQWYSAGKSAGGAVLEGISDTVASSTRIVGFLTGVDSGHLNTLGLLLKGASVMPSIADPEIDSRLFLVGRTKVLEGDSMEFSDEDHVRSLASTEVWLTKVTIWYSTELHALVGVQCEWSAGGTDVVGGVHSGTYYDASEIQFTLELGEYISSIVYQESTNGIGFLHISTSSGGVMGIGSLVDSAPTRGSTWVHTDERLVGFYGAVGTDRISGLGLVKMITHEMYPTTSTETTSSTTEEFWFSSAGSPPAGWLIAILALVILFN